MRICVYFPVLQLAVYGYHFWIVFAVEFIPMVKNIIKSKKVCARASTFRHLWAFLFIFSIFFSNGCLWIPFSNSFTWEFFPMVKITIKSKNCFKALLWIFVQNCHIFSIGWLWMPLLNSFCGRIHFHSPK